MRLTAQFITRLKPRTIALVYLAALSMAELVTVLGDPRIGQMLNLAILFILLVHSALSWERPVHRFLVSLALVPLIRIVSLALPLTGFQLEYWYLLVGIPLLAATFVVVRAIEFRINLVSDHMGQLLTQLGFGLTGLMFGYFEYQILQPQPLLATYNWRQIIIVGAILLVFTGFLEELIFRGLLQQTATEQLGSRRGILYVAVIFAVLHAGYGSLIDIIFVLMIGLLFGLFVARTGNLLGVTLAHGVTNIMLFLIMPVLFLPTVPQA